MTVPQNHEPLPGKLIAVKGKTAPVIGKKKSAMKQFQLRRLPHSDHTKPNSIRSSLPNRSPLNTITSKAPPQTRPISKKSPSPKLAAKRVLNEGSSTRDPMKFLTDALDIEWNNYRKYLRAFEARTSVNNVHDLR